jgi:flagellar biosynthesis protein FlhB
LRTLVDILSSLGLKLALVLAVIAIVDMVYMQRHFANQMKMSHKDIKDEHKNREVIRAYAPECVNFGWKCEKNRRLS